LIERRLVGDLELDLNLSSLSSLHETSLSSRNERERGLIERMLVGFDKIMSHYNGHGLNP
jgi:hypothetical protein